MSRGPSRATLLGLALVLLLCLVLLAIAHTAGRALHLVAGPGETRITQGVVISRIEAVSKLVTSETTLRDVVTYENTRLGSTKRSLVVVTGKALVGIDLSKSRGIEIDPQAHHIIIHVPHAQLLGVDVMDLKTYDESRGLWNPFQPADRDTIFQLARARLESAARELEVRQHAEESARRLLTALFAPDGYTVDVEFEPFLATPEPN
ncbi:MAG TPA: DUF4230 domain-containing protein [Gemmatimonadales bacterium]|nr:DUF4230 domain-containing protein [Gemmatimonadales bacterium]